MAAPGDEWTVVDYRKRSHRRRAPRSSAARTVLEHETQLRLRPSCSSPGAIDSSTEDDADEKSVCRIKDEIGSLRNKLANSSGFQSFQTLFASACEEQRIVTDMRFVCLGLGSPIAHPDARLQLAVLLELIASTAAGDAPSSPSCYDPIFSASDKALLRALGCTCAARADVPASGAAILFMPHCYREIFEAALAPRWNEESLLRTVIIGNSFKSFVDRMTRRDVEVARRERSRVLRIAAVCDESAISPAAVLETHALVDCAIVRVRLQHIASVFTR